MANFNWNVIFQRDDGARVNRFVDSAPDAEDALRQAREANPAQFLEHIRAVAIRLGPARVFKPGASEPELQPAPT